ncbi:hypothetical protein LTR17_020189 [Elasticomyces elasticus]|nr:hypothetical protein LTR17_020189 [Elasticomyces elasticus]
MEETSGLTMTFHPTELQRRAETFAPLAIEDLNTHLSKASRMVLAILRHNITQEIWQAEPQNAFVWVKGRDKVTVDEVRNAYLSRSEKPGLQFDLKIADFSPPGHMKMSQLASGPARILVFVAVDLNPPRPASITPKRQPLQPVKRQLSTPLRHSQDEARSLKTDHERRNTPIRERLQAARQPTVPRRSNGEVKREHADTQPPMGSVAAAQALLDGQLHGNADVDDDYKPRAQDEPFPASQEQEDEKPQKRGAQIQALLKETSPERLEAAVTAGAKVLDELRLPLLNLPGNNDAVSWLEQIETVRKLAARTRTIVGVVGNTGAGKSSVINAMLDEERLVPTNCMRACTAVVTELSYNDSASEKSKYRAEIEFIQENDWRKELEILFKEVIDENGGISRDAQNPDTEAGIAYAKIRAVYHKYTKDMLGKATVDSLMRVKGVQSVLGTTRRLNESNPSVFYKRLQGYVDSKEKEQVKLDKNGNKITNPHREFEFWPLIKVVKIYTKAVDDKAAKSLLGNTFKRQLKYDGTYSAVTFICSKTDDISRTEASESLGLEEYRELEERQDDIDRKKRVLNKELKELKNKKDDHEEAIDQIENDIEAWEDLEGNVEDGKTVYAPSNKSSKKRKSDDEKPTASRKRRKISADSDDESEAVGGAAPAESQRQPLTSDDIFEKLADLKQLKKEARRERTSIDGEITALKEKLKPIEAEEKEIDAKMSAICIRGRNEYSRDAIRQDFADGIRELDQENAEEEDPDAFDPTEDIRDYEQVAKDLPVFCVSSRAYQKLEGRFKKDKDVPGFESKDQTEIPQLQFHCKKLTEKGREAGCRRFLNSLTQFLTSLGLWSSDDGSGKNNLNGKQRDMERDYLNKRLKELERALEKAVAETMEDVEQTLNDQIFDKFAPAIDAASDAAGPTSAKWGAHKNDGGLYWGSYKATVKCNGVFSSAAAGARDFNGDLTEPLYKQLASTWEKAFQRRLPHILQSFTRAGSDLLRKFHATVAERCRQKGHGVARIGVLQAQLQTYQAIFADLATMTIAGISEGQREINREFTPVIAAAMQDAYDWCTNETGKGQYNRMKSMMASHVEQERSSMFTDAADQVRQSLTAMCKRVRESMLEKSDSIYTGVHRDYMSLIGNVDVKFEFGRQERQLRGDVDEIIDKADDYFQEVIDADLSDLDTKDEPVADEGDTEEDNDDVLASESEVDADEDNDDLESSARDGSVEADGSGVSASGGAETPTMDDSDVEEGDFQPSSPS